MISQNQSFKMRKDKFKHILKIILIVKLNQNKVLSNKAVQKKLNYFSFSLYKMLKIINVTFFWHFVPF